ncbi:hypothetical protein RI129_011894 [Pyrocoelia pectoralis]|uniref:Fibronectin type-III domain-containing protein n=1 Tax=Pyrocoelia pectoralis TaxID=417401 RepID=A0AAN7V158_9COLE
MKLQKQFFPYISIRVDILIVEVLCVGNGLSIMLCCVCNRVSICEGRIECCVSFCDEASIEIKILDKPGKPEGPLKISDVHKEGCSLRWNPPEDDGGVPIEGYLVEKMDTDTGRWVPAGRSKEPKIDLDNLEPGKEYKFRVSAVNPEGISEPLEADHSIVAKNPFGPWSSSSDIIVCRAPPSAPKITSDLSIRDIIVVAGEEFTISVPYTATPKPTASWSVNGNEFVPDNRIKIDTNDISSVFHNKCAKRSDAGNYTIKLTNSVGSDSATCRVQVVDKPQPPQGPLDVSDITPDNCSLAWRPPLDDGGSPITNYIVEKLDPSGVRSLNMRRY